MAASRNLGKKFSVAAGGFEPGCVQDVPGEVFELAPGQGRVGAVAGSTAGLQLEADLLM